MRIRASESERAHTHHEFPPRLERQCRGHRREVQAREVDVGIRLVQADVRRYATVAQDIKRLDQASHAGRGFEMADIALHRSDREGLLLRSALAERLADGSRL